MLGLSDITIFSVISLPYRYIGNFDITIPRYNDVILLLPWHIVISGLRCTCMNRSFPSVIFITTQTHTSKDNKLLP